MYEPTSNLTLSPIAEALGPEKLTAQARLAEHLLGVDSEAYDDLVGDPMKQAIWGEMVALQINYQIEKNEALVHEGLGDLQRTFRRDTLISPSARLLRDRFLAEYCDGGSVVMTAIGEE